MLHLLSIQLGWRRLPALDPVLVMPTLAAMMIREALDGTAPTLIQMDGPWHVQLDTSARPVTPVRIAHARVGLVHGVGRPGPVHLWGHRTVRALTANGIRAADAVRTTLVQIRVSAQGTTTPIPNR